MSQEELVQFVGCFHYVHIYTIVNPNNAFDKKKIMDTQWGGRKMRLLWSEYAMDLARVASRRSEDPWIKVGACVLRHDNSIGGLGYNGPPPKVDINWKDRDERRKRVIHAEINALRYIRPGECRLLACTLMPCNDCLRTIASYGIGEVIFGEVYERDRSTADLAQEFGIKLKFDSRRERFDQTCS